MVSSYIKFKQNYRRIYTEDFPLIELFDTGASSDYKKLGLPETPMKVKKKMRAKL